ncbi:MAG: hypothetical protein ACE149_03040 [Armatimonadota bacterium]
MRKDFSTISASSALIAFVAGTVLCMQVSTITSASPTASQISGPVLWVVEIALFGTAVFAWRPRASFVGWVLGIASLAVVRTALVSGAAVIVSAMHGTTNMAPALQQTSALLPRVCAVGFALMVCYPTRIWLPLREVEPGQPKARRRRGATSNLEDGDRLLIVTTGARAASQDEPPKAEVKLHDAVGVRSTMPLIEGELELPLSTVLALLPENLVTDRALALADSEAMRLPFHVVLPQLKEAQVVFSVADLRTYVPEAISKLLVEPADSDIDTENGLVSLPLSLIVPQLPAEALELPPPSPPAWAKVDAEEHVVFATV